MRYDDFINTYLGKSIDWDGQYGFQCVDEVAQYCSDNGKPVAYANAKDWFQHPALDGAFDSIGNDPNDPNQVPTRGDIVIWGGNSPGSGGYGHIAIFDMAIDVNHFQSLDQNWNGAYVHFVTHSWSYVIGWLHPKEDPAPLSPAPAPPMEDIPETTTTTTTEVPTTTTTTVAPEPEPETTTTTTTRVEPDAPTTTTTTTVAPATDPIPAPIPIRATRLTREQWISVIRNTLFAAAAAFITSIQVTGFNSRAAVFTGLTAAGTAVFKIVEKTFQQDK